MMQPPKSAQSSAPAGPSFHTAKQKSEFNLGGRGTDWDIHFAAYEDLSNAITFRRNVEDVGSPGTSAHTLSMFSVSGGSIRFRDSRTLDASRPDGHGGTRNMKVVVAANVEVSCQAFDVLRHEENDSDWITVIRLKPGRRFMVEQSPMIPANPPRPLLLRYDVLRLWNQRFHIQAMPYMAIVMRNYRTYVPWCLVLQNGMLGPLVTLSHGGSQPPPAVLHRSSAPLAPPLTATEDKPLIDLYSGDLLPPSPTLGETAECTTPVSEHPSGEPANIPAEGPSDLTSEEAEEVPSEEPAEQTSSDPFGGVFEHARAKYGKGKEKEI
jgi:hypothetical protein